VIRARSTNGEITKPNIGADLTMTIKRILSAFATFAFVGLVGCGDDRSVERTEQEIFTQPTTETVEMPVMTEDTFMVERTTEVRVDTTQVDGDDVRVAPGTTTPGTTAPGTTTPGTAPR
jgi:hypothetical protein